MSKARAIEALVGSLADAWNHGDSFAYAAHFAEDGYFTNVFGMSYYGRKAFEERHAEVFESFAKGSSVGLAIRKIRFIRPDVAIVDVDTELTGWRTLPPGVKGGPDGLLRSKVLLVLAKEKDEWWVYAYHNVAVTPIGKS